MRDPVGGAESGATGEYTVVDPPRRLVFTWVWDDQPDLPQLIELEFSERDGRTTVWMTNSSIPSDERAGEPATAGGTCASTTSNACWPDEHRGEREPSAHCADRLRGRGRW